MHLLLPLCSYFLCELMPDTCFIARSFSPDLVVTRKPAKSLLGQTLCSPPSIPPPSPLDQWAVEIQRMCRGLLTRRKWERAQQMWLRCAATHVQRCWRGATIRRVLKYAIELWHTVAVTHMQRCWRGTLGRKRLCRARAIWLACAATHVQRLWRGSGPRRGFGAFRARRHNAAARLQSWQAKHRCPFREASPQTLLFEQQIRFSCGTYQKKSPQLPRRIRLLQLTLRALTTRIWSWFSRPPCLLPFPSPRLPARTWLRRRHRRLLGISACLTLTPVCPHFAARGHHPPPHGRHLHSIRLPWPPCAPGLHACSRRGPRHRHPRHAERD